MTTTRANPAEVQALTLSIPQLIFGFMVGPATYLTVVFLLNGESLTNSMMFAVIAGVAGWMAVRQLRNAFNLYLLKRRGEIVEADIIDFDMTAHERQVGGRNWASVAISIAASTRGPAYSYFIIYRIDDGPLTRQQISGAQFQSIRRGDRLPARYLPDKPRISQLLI